MPRNKICSIAMTMVWIAGCGGDDPDETGTKQAATTCPRVEPADVPSLSWSPCDPSPLECATLEVPVDHANPSGERYALDVIRYSAGDPERRRGVVIAQTGGPGESSVALVRDKFYLMAAPEVHASFDIIGVDGRGVSAATRADCFGSDLHEERKSLDTMPDTDEGWAKLDDFWKRVASDCNGRYPVEKTSTFSTCQSVADFELLRIALGESELNYLGFSYGTMVGAAYASTYPERVRAFVLDSAVNQETDFPAARADTPRLLGYEQALRRAALDCTMNATCPFQSLSSEQIVSEFAGVVQALREKPLFVDSREVNASTAHFATRRALNTQAIDALWTAVAAAKAGDGTKLLALSDQFGSPPFGRQYLIVLNDRPCPQGFDVASARALADAAAAEAPLFGRALAEDAFICLGWAEPPERKPLELTKTSAPPLLIVGGNLDLVAPGVYANQMAETLGNGSHVLIHDSPAHVAFPVNECVRQASGAYLMDPSGKPPSACGTQ